MLFNINNLKSFFMRAAMALSLACLLGGCVKNAALPDYPSESSVRAAFARIAIDLAERSGDHPSSQWWLWLKSVRNDADNWMRGENGALVPFDLDAMASLLGQMLCSPAVFQSGLAEMRIRYPRAGGNCVTCLAWRASPTIRPNWSVRFSRG